MKRQCSFLIVLLCSTPLYSHAFGERMVDVPLGGASILSLGGISGAAELTETSIARVKPYGSDLIVYGKKIGETTLLIKSANGNASWLIRVSLPASAIQGELDKLFPDDRVTARALGGTIVLTGAVSNVVVIKQIEEVAMGYLRSPSIADLGVEPHVINLLTVRAAQQVQLEVKFAEVNRRSLREISAGLTAVMDNSKALEGIAGGTDQSVFGGVGIGPSSAAQIGAAGAAGLAGTGPVGATPAASSFGTFFFGSQFGSFPFAATLSLLAERRLSRTLAEPTLVAMSGQEASFLAGGEVPLQKSNGLTENSVEYKPFGVELTFQPTVLGDKTIQLSTSVSLSDTDPTINVAGNVGFKRRSSRTTVRLRDGQSFAIAGLMKDELTKVVQKMPGLAEIPIIGLLFKSKNFLRLETELVVVVTVKLVDPLEDGQLPPLPGSDGPTDPTDLQMFLLNLDEPAASKPSPRAGPRRRPSGRLGFSR
jgi:pilus assembly protein CpaC